MKNQSVSNNIDWITISLYVALVAVGWMTIYSADMTPSSAYYFDFDQNYGKQLIFISFTVLLIIVILTIDAKFYERFSSVLFGSSLLLLVGLFFFGKPLPVKDVGMPLVDLHCSLPSLQKPPLLWLWPNT